MPPVYPIPLNGSFFLELRSRETGVGTSLRRFGTVFLSPYTGARTERRGRYQSSGPCQGWGPTRLVRYTDRVEGKSRRSGRRPGGERTGEVTGRGRGAGCCVGRKASCKDGRPHTRDMLLRPNGTVGTSRPHLPPVGPRPKDWRDPSLRHRGPDSSRNRPVESSGWGWGGTGRRVWPTRNSRE